MTIIINLRSYSKSNTCWMSMDDETGFGQYFPVIDQVNKIKPFFKLFTADQITSASGSKDRVKYTPENICYGEYIRYGRRVYFNMHLLAGIYHIWYNMNFRWVNFINCHLNVLLFKRTNTIVTMDVGFKGSYKKQKNTGCRKYFRAAMVQDIHEFCFPVQSGGLSD